MRTFLTLIPLALAVCLQADSPLPTSPSGYSWQRLSAISSAILKPDGWFFKQSKKGQTDGFFITKEDITQSGTFKTGLTLNCLRDITKKTGQSPTAYALSLVDAAASKHKLIEQSSSNQGVFHAFRFRYEDAPPDKESITIYQVLIANDKTGTLFMVIFESPTSSWSEAWAKGEVILKRMLLDDEI